MKKEVADKWIKALKSGKYKQGGGSLRPSDNTYCCLGVLCDLAVKEGVISRPARNGFNHLTYGLKDDLNVDVLPQEVMEWAGMKTANGAFSQASLTNLNDGGAYGVRHSFEEIAEEIKKHVDEL